MNALVQCAIYLGVLLLLVKPLGAYMADVYEGKYRFLAPLENLVYRSAGVQAEEEMDWKRYLSGTLWFNALGFLLVYLLQRLQHRLPLNPQQLRDASKAGDRGRQPLEQPLALGPAASQIAIKQLGSNGGGFFNVNSAHPYENPTPLSNFLEMLSILLIPGALCYTFGRMVGDTRQGCALLAAMLVIFVPLLLGCTLAEQAGNPALAGLHVDQHASALQAGRNKEGHETR